MASNPSCRTGDLGPARVSANAAADGLDGRHPTMPVDLPVAGRRVTAGYALRDKQISRILTSDAVRAKQTTLAMGQCEPTPAR
ncbi:MAG: hypothetical protein ABW001_04205 [Mycobacterium sp.]